MSDDFRLSDLIVSGLDKDKIHTVVRLVAEANDLTDQEKSSSLVLSGVALGVEEALSRIMVDHGPRENFLSELVHALDAWLDKATNLETSTALAEIRKTIAGELQKVTTVRQDAFLSRVYTAIGASPEIVTGTQPVEEYERLDLVAIGAEMHRRVPEALYGWHHGRTEGYPAEMTCRCVPCHVRLFDSLAPASQEIALRRTVADSGGMDNALAEYAVFVIKDLRDQLQDLRKGMPDLHDIDPASSADQFKQVMERVKNL